MSIKKAILETITSLKSCIFDDILNLRTMRLLLMLSTLLLFACGTNKKTNIAPSKTDAKIEIIQTLQKQEDAWSRGDIDAFMQGYWKSPKLTFVGQSGVTYGWGQTLENYKKSYPTKEDMGKLEFDIIEMERLAPDVFRVLGQFKLYRKNDNPSGYFSLIWKYIDGKWVIVSDHSS